MGNSDSAKIIDTSTIGLSKTRIHYHLPPKSWTKSKAPNSLPNLMSDGVIIMSGSKLRTNGKQHSKQTEDYLEPTVMFFGMCNSLATFQAMMDSIFSNMIEERRVIVYMDNILIFAENQQELQE
jgi:Reverse transcriptase (RNA-dependent DNA polymerase)